MSNTRECLLKLGLSYLFWLSALNVAAMAQTNSANPVQTPETPLTREIVTELQRLRQAVERSTVNQYRVTIAIERLRVQQESLGRLSRDLENARRAATDLQTNRAMMTERAKELEQAVNTATDAQHRKALEEEQKQFKLQLGRIEQLEQTERTRETELRTRLDVEQGKLNDLNERLDALEREFEKQAVTSTPAASGKKRD
jgi:hypothetical protein